MTGWQSGGGDQGWNQNQPFGPDSQTNRYGADPYTSPYGGDPYGADPYSGGYDPYQQQYPPTGGFPTPGYGPPPPPPKRSKLPMILSLVAIVIIVGAVVAIVIVNRKDTGQPIAEETSSSKTAPKSESSSSDAPTSTSGEKDDWIAIDNKAEAGLSYQVPPDWKTSTENVGSGQGIDFNGAADYGTYECEGANYVRTFAASGDVQGSNDKDLDLATTLEDFAKSFGTTYYGENAEVTVGAPTDTKVDGKTAMTVTAKVKQQVTNPNCQATEGEVALVGVLLETEGQPKGVAMLVVVNDLTGGPSEPKPLDPSVTQEILGTVKAG